MRLIWLVMYPYPSLMAGLQIQEKALEVQGLWDEVLLFIPTTTEP